MIKEDIKSSKKSIVFMKNSLANCYAEVNGIILLVMKYLKSCKELIEPLTDSSSKLIAKRNLASPLAVLLDKHTDFFISVKSEYVTKLNQNLKSIESVKEKVDRSFMDLRTRLENVLSSLQEVSRLYSYKYRQNVKSVKEFSDERRKIQERSINDSRDSFVKYVVSTKEKNNKQIKKLLYLEKSSKDELNRTIEMINNSLENVNNVQVSLLPNYENTMSEMFSLVEKVLYSVAAVDRQKVIESFTNLNDELVNMLNNREGMEDSEAISRENLKILKYMYKLIAKFSTNYKDIYKSTETTIMRPSKLLPSKKTSGIAIIEEWREILKTYINGKLKLQEALCNYISAELKSKLEAIVQTLKTQRISSSKLAKQICKLIDNLFKFVMRNFAQRVTQSSEYVKLIKVTSTDLTFSSAVGKLKYINLVDAQDTPTMVEDSSTDEESPKKLRAHANNEFLQENFGVSEALIESYLCALHWRFILQGRLYVTQCSLCFYSAFNSATFFGQSTRIAIPFCDVIEVKKESNALIFDNAVSVKTAKTQFFFSGFLYRDRAYDLINRLCEEAEKPKLKVKLFKKPLLLPSPTKDQSQESSESFLATLEEIGKRRLRLAREKHGLKMPTTAPHFDETYDCPIQILLVALLDKLHPTSLLVLERVGSKDIAVESKETPPKYFMSYKHALKEVMRGNKEDFLREVRGWPISTRMRIRYRHALKEVVPIPFMPREFAITETGAVFYFSPNHVVVCLQMNEYGVPYSDYFVTRQWLEVTQTLSNRSYKTRWRVYIEIDFIKKTIFKPIIESIGLAKINSILNENRAIYKDYVEKEMPKFSRSVESRAPPKAAVKAWRPSVRRSVVSELVVKQMGERWMYTAKINQLLSNQRKICAIIAVVVIAFLILFKI